MHDSEEELIVKRDHMEQHHANALWLVLPQQDKHICQTSTKNFSKIWSLATNFPPTHPDKTLTAFFFRLLRHVILVESERGAGLPKLVTLRFTNTLLTLLAIPSDVGDEVRYERSR